MTLADRLLDALPWVLERKDMECFWPVGLESAGTKYWPQLAQDLEVAVGRPGACNSGPDYPTAFVALAFTLIYGLRELEWDSRRSLDLLNSILDLAQRRKSGDLLNSDGSNRMWGDEILRQHLDEAVVVDGFKSAAAPDMHALSGSILAYAEAAYFMNHRVCTEKHGPYDLEDGRMALVRSFKNLRPSAIWPSDAVGGLPEGEFHLIYKYRPFAVRFDVFSNVIYEADVNRHLEGVFVGSSGEGPSPADWNVEYANELAASLASGVTSLTSLVGRMSAQDRAERLTEILYYSGRGILGDGWCELAHSALSVGRMRQVRQPVPRYGVDRLRYYDLRN